jgi:hypothetical protein
MGLAGMIGEMVMRCDRDISGHAPRRLDAIRGHSEAAWRALAQFITALENGQGAGESGTVDASMLKALREGAAAVKVPVLGVTGTGGAGKSSLTDELIRRIRLDTGLRVRFRPCGCGNMAHFHGERCPGRAGFVRRRRFPAHHARFRPGRRLVLPPRVGETGFGAGCVSRISAARIRAPLG